MFYAARLKITLWYLLIIMLISLSFSVVIYRVLSHEFVRLASIQRFRIDRRVISVVDTDLVDEAKHRLALALLIVNTGILAIAGALAYLLSGQTLQPIQVMVTEQNQFITDSSHEFRTPLTSLKSAIEVNLRDPHLTLASAKKLLTDSITDVNRLQALSDSLLLLTHYQTPHSNWQPQPVQLTEVAQYAIHRISPQAKLKNITLQNDIVPAVITGEKYSLCDLFVILLDNAVKYSPRGTVVALRSEKNAASVKISIIDHGIGISKTDLPRVFDRFFRSNQARATPGIPGYGLGLSIAKKIAALHRGTISVHSLPGQGTTFQLVFSLRS